MKKKKKRIKFLANPVYQISLDSQWQPTPVFLPRESQGPGSDLAAAAAADSSLGEGSGTPLQYSCLENSMDGGAPCSPRGREESDTTERLHFHFSLSFVGEGNGNPLQCSCLENPRDGGAWWAAVYGVAQSRARLKRLSSSSSSRQFFNCIQSLQEI